MNFIYKDKKIIKKTKNYLGLITTIKNREVLCLMINNGFKCRALGSEKDIPNLKYFTVTDLLFSSQ
ncbi:hypothetical protein LCGC14_1044950 [marine sediment metagenome]|uniref:Uncharacterized protein n=1 Tax=marine sediment metagenome TaxID=412755 RepID=A0A0F9QWS7_9ZZZZ|nr:hypothetical protein [Candidatus Anoxychlamydiales bacterium]